MQWPPELIAVLSQGLDVEPVEGLSREHVYEALLDETARRAVWRARGNPALLGAALRTPYTPLGSTTAEGVNGLARRLTFNGAAWGAAVDAIHHYLEEHAEAVCANFQAEAQPYASDIGLDAVFGPRPEGSDA